MWHYGWTPDLAKDDVTTIGNAEWALICRLAYFVGDDRERIARLYKMSAVSRQEGVTKRTNTVIDRALYDVPEDQIYQPTAEDLTVQDDVGTGPLAYVVHSLPIDAATHTHAFRLRQHLISNPERDTRATIVEYAKLIGEDVEEFVTQYDGIAPIVKYGEGESRFSNAVTLAEERPYPAHYVDVPTYQTFVSVYYYMALSNDGVFWMNANENDGHFGKTPTTYGRWLERMEHVDKLITCVDPTYDHRRKKAKVYQWTGPLLDDDSAKEIILQLNGERRTA